MSLYSKIVGKLVEIHDRRPVRINHRERWKSACQSSQQSSTLFLTIYLGIATTSLAGHDRATLFDLLDKDGTGGLHGSAATMSIRVRFPRFSRVVARVGELVESLGGESRRSARHVAHDSHRNAYCDTRRTPDYSMYEVAKSRLRDESLGSPRPEIATLLTLLQYIFRNVVHGPQACAVVVARAKGVHTHGRAPRMQARRRDFSPSRGEHPLGNWRVTETETGWSLIYIHFQLNLGD